MADVIRLERQSTTKYNLFRIVKPRGYYIERVKDNKRTKVLTVDEAENFILYGITGNDVKQLEFN